MIIFRAEVFSAIDVPTMIQNLGSTRFKTEGIELENRIYNEITKEFSIIPMTQVYELHRINGEKIGITENLYAIKCWCTSTNTEHWLWTEETKSPLKAIANTCVVYEGMIPFIKHIIRQGDIFLFELADKNYRVNFEDKLVPLSKEIYFKLLKSQS